MRAKGLKRPKRFGAADRADQAWPLLHSPGIGHNQPPPTMEPFAVRVPQAARLLSVCERSIWSWIAEGRLTAYRVSDRITLVGVASIRALLDSGGSVAPRTFGRRKEAATTAQS